VEIIARPTKNFAKGNTGLDVQPILLDRYNSFPAHVPIRGDQGINIVRSQRNFGRLTCAFFLFEISPPFLSGLDLLVRSSEFWNRRWRFRNRLRFRQPINSMDYCRMTLESPKQSGKTGNGQHDRKGKKDETASGETAQSPSWRRRLNPGVHKT